MDKQLQELRDDVEKASKLICDHITESTYYRAGKVKEYQEIKLHLESLSNQMKILIEIYTGANLLKRMIIGLVAFFGTLTGIIYAWLHILKKS